MSDTRRRELERSASSDVAARAALIAERLRAGQVSVEQVRLAAYVDEPAARAVLGAAAPTAPRDLGAWWSGLLDRHDALARVACALAARALRGSPTSEGLERLDRAHDLLVCPCWWCEERVRVAHDPFFATAAPEGLELVQWAEGLALSAARGWSRAPEHAAQRLTQVRRAGIGRGELRTVVRDAVGRWLLDSDAPLVGPERLAALRAPRTVALLRAPCGEVDGIDLLPHLGANEVMRELAPLDALWTLRAPGAQRWSTWRIGAPDRERLGFAGPAGLGLTLFPAVWRVDAFVRWAELGADAELRRLLRRAVAALARAVGAESSVWTPSGAAAIEANVEAGASFEAVRDQCMSLWGPPGDLDRAAPTGAAWFLEPQAPTTAS